MTRESQSFLFVSFTPSSIFFDNGTRVLNKPFR